MSEKELINLARELLNVANRVVGMVGLEKSEYDECVKILQECIQMLNDWLRKCEEGTLGAEKPA